MKEHSWFVRTGAVLLGLGALLNASVAWGQGFGFRVLHTFDGASHGGRKPMGTLLADGDWVYGTTREGGWRGYGTVFRVRADGSGFMTLYSFGVSVNDGRYPEGGLFDGGDGMLYGTTFEGGLGGGTVFRLSKQGTDAPPPPGYTKNYSKLYDFNGWNGTHPAGGVIQASDGFLYGTTRKGGIAGGGVVFKLSPSGGLMNLYPIGAAADNTFGSGALVEGGNRVLFGTTASYDGGSVFRIEISTETYSVVRVTAWTLRGGLLYVPGSPFEGLMHGAFGNQWGSGFLWFGEVGSRVDHAHLPDDGSLGLYPIGPLVRVDGRLYSVCTTGGADNQGTLLEVRSPDPVVLHHFSESEGAHPQGGMAIDSQGAMYGVTSGDNGVHNHGMVFRYRARPESPEIGVYANGREILDGSTSPSPEDPTDFGTAGMRAGRVTRTFLISNIGLTTLTLSGDPLVLVEGEQEADFTVTRQPETTVDYPFQASFEITFVPQELGLRRAKVSIASNDPDEDPFDFAIQGMGAPAGPDVEVTSDVGTRIPNGSVPNPDYGTILPGVLPGEGMGVEGIFVIRNAGTEFLELYDVSVESETGEFWLNWGPSVTGLAYDETTQFGVYFQPAFAGVQRATVRIESNGQSYAFEIQGEGSLPAPEIEVSGNGITITDGDDSPGFEDHTDLGLVLAGRIVTRTFVVANRGTVELALQGNPVVRLVGGNGNSHFEVTQQPSEVVLLPGTETTFEVGFRAAPGRHSARLFIGSSDADEAEYDFVIQAGGLAAGPPRDLARPGELPLDGFGRALCLSADGNTALLGAPGRYYEEQDHGSAYVFVRRNGDWEYQATLTAADGEGLDYFGTSVALSGDGNIALIGVPGDDRYVGSVRVFERTAGFWAPTARLDQMSSADGLSDDGGTALVGGVLFRNRDGWQRGPILGSAGRLCANGSRAAVRTSIGVGVLSSSSEWGPTETLSAPTFPPVDGIGQRVDGFGTALGLSGDGSLVAVGAPFGNEYGRPPPVVMHGTVYLFVPGNLGWQEEERLSVSGDEVEDYFGASVDVSHDGRVVLVGAPLLRSAYVFARGEDGWNRVATLTSGYAAEVQFGTSVSLSGDGRTALVGGDGNLGGVSVFDLDAEVQPNLPPTASDVTYSRLPDQKLKIAIRELLDRCSDPELDPIVLESVETTSATGATIRIQGGHILYLPIRNDEDTFGYTVGDGVANASATITVRVEAGGGGGGLPKQAQLDMTNGTATFRTFGIPGTLYDVQRTTDLSPPVQWTTLNPSPLSPGPDGVIVFVDSLPPAGTAYYRSAVSVTGVP